MVPPLAPSRLTRRSLFAAWATLLLPAAAWADDDDDDGGHGRGRGRGRGRGGDEDDRGSDSDHGGGSDDDDRGGSGSHEGSGDDHAGGSGGDDDNSGRSGSGARRDDGRASQGWGVPRDIAVYYPDGWVERIAGGRYELIDDMSRLVVRRPATGEDFSRMEALR